MNLLKLIFMTVSFTLAVGSHAADRATAKDAQMLVAKAQAELKARGVDASIKTFGEAGWKDRDLYVFVLRYDGVIVAHGGNPGLLGKSLIDVKDADGKLFIRDMIQVAKSAGKGWVDYLWSNPVSKKVEPKTTYLEAIPGYDGLVAVGIYKP